MPLTDVYQQRCPHMGVRGRGTPEGAFLYCGGPPGRFSRCCPKTTNPAVILRRAVPRQNFWNVDLVGFFSVSSGFVPPARLHLTYPESDMSGRRDPEVYGGYF